MQGRAVDRAFFYLSPSMDAQLFYVALTRHRDDVILYASREDFRSKGDLVELMARDRLQDSTALYRDRVDYADVIRGFAERRGFPTTPVITDFVKFQIHYLCERLDRLVARFDRLQHLAPECRPILVPEKDGGSEDVMRDRPRKRPPEMSLQLDQSVSRLTRSLASEHSHGRKARSFGRSAHYELNLATSADELCAFNANLRSVFPKDAILNHGPHEPKDDTPVLGGLSDGWTKFARENWSEIFAAQRAEIQETLLPLTERSRPWDVGRAAAFTEGPERKPTRTQDNDRTPNRVRHTMSSDKPLINAVPDLRH